MKYFIDFEDSFNFNLLDILKRFGDIEVVHYKDSSTINYKSGDVLILGPGPGHVDEYLKYLPNLKKLKSDGIFLLGICLGHQIILSEIYSAKISKSRNIVHGRKVELRGGEFVQRYNSWTVEYNALSFAHILLDTYGELAIFDNKENVLTMQFHPESVGTSFPNKYFKTLEAFLRYPKLDELSQLSRHL